MTLPLRSVHKVDLLFGPFLSRVRIEHADLAWFHTIYGASLTEVKVDSAIKALDLVLNEERDLDVTILKELVHLHANYLPIVCRAVITHLNERGLCIDNICFSFSAFDKRFDSLQVLLCDVEDFFWLHSHLDLVLDAHDH